MKAYVERLKKYYDKGLYSYDSILRLWDKGLIDDSELAYILGDD